MNEPKLALKSHRWIQILLVLVFLIVVFWIAQRKLVPDFAVINVGNKEIAPNMVVSGRVQSPVIIEVVSKVDGKVLSIPVSEGQRVQEGQTLMVLESIEAKANLAKASAMVAKATARLHKIKELTQPISEQLLIQAQGSLESAKKQYERTKELSTKGYVSQSQLDDAMRNLAIAQSQVSNSKFQARSSKEKGSDYLQAELALKKARAYEGAAKIALANTVIKASSIGTLISKNVEPGNVALAGKPLMLLSPGDNTHVVVYLDEKKRRYLQLGQMAEIVADTFPGEHFMATISYMSESDNNSSVEVRLDVPVPPEYLRQDMTVSVDFKFIKSVKTTRLPTPFFSKGVRT
jgi:HlyD family secretion protein